jgi:hypothetical protein
MASAAVLHTISKFVLFTFIVVGVFGLLMSMSKDVHISNVKCVVGQTTNGQCPNVPEHISQWENTFTGIISATDTLLLCVLALTLLLSTKLYTYSRRYSSTNYLKGNSSRPSLFELTFTQGIVQPTL